MRIANNRFIATTLPLRDKGRRVMHIESSRNISLQTNTVENPQAQDTLVTRVKNVEAITGNDPTGIRPATGK